MSRDEWIRSVGVLILRSRGVGAVRPADVTALLDAYDTHLADQTKEQSDAK